jgi:proline iminopeptidase
MRTFLARLAARACVLALGASAMGAELPVAPAATTPPAEAGALIHAPGANLYVEVRGARAAGAPLVLVNGGPGFDHGYLHSSAAWDVLGRSRPVVFYDQRGNGRSGPLAKGQSCTLADQLADLEALRAHLGAERIDLLGHSWGGFLAMAYAARHPEHVRHLIICDSAAPKWSDTPFLFSEVFPDVVERQESHGFATALGEAAAEKAGIRDYLSMLFYSTAKRDEFLAHAGDYLYTRDVHGAIVADLGRFDLGPELRKFRFPTLVVTGRFDINVAAVCAWRIHRAIPGSRLAVFEHSGHLPFYEEPEEFVRLIEEFLGAP